MIERLSMASGGINQVLSVQFQNAAQGFEKLSRKYSMTRLDMNKRHASEDEWRNRFASSTKATFFRFSLTEQVLLCPSPVHLPIIHSVVFSAKNDSQGYFYYFFLVSQK